MAIATVQFSGGMLFAAHTASGHEVRMDASPDVGGANQGARPMELLLAALGGCSGIDVVAMLKKMRVTIADFAIELDGDRETEDPKVYRTIHLAYRLTSPDAAPEQLCRAVHLSQEKYCSASAMLNQAAPMSVSIFLNGQELESFTR